MEIPCRWPVPLQWRRGVWGGGHWASEQPAGQGSLGKRKAKKRLRTDPAGLSTSRRFRPASQFFCERLAHLLLSLSCCCGPALGTGADVPGSFLVSFRVGLEGILETVLRPPNSKCGKVHFPLNGVHVGAGGRDQGGPGACMRVTFRMAGEHPLRKRGGPGCECQ